MSQLQWSIHSPPGSQLSTSSAPGATQISAGGIIQGQPAVTTIFTLQDTRGDFTEVALVRGVLARALGLSTARGGGTAGGTAGAGGHLARLQHGGAQQEQQGEGWETHSAVSGQTLLGPQFIYHHFFTLITHISLCFVPCSGPIQRHRGSCFHFIPI